MIDWIERNQLGRRNLKPDQMSMLRGNIYRRAKKAHGGTGSNQYSEQSGQNDRSAKTAERIATQTGVSEKTVRRDAAFVAAVEAVAEVCILSLATALADAYEGSPSGLGGGVGRKYGETSRDRSALV
jgi:hypothetical protein